jgi:F1F0 ATPase subunit 2
MTFVELLLYITAAGGGVVLGLVYFLGLWLTVKKVPGVRRPYLFLSGSFLIRMALVLAGFYVLLTYNWTYLILAMVTFLITRHWVIQRKGKPSEMLYG